MEKMEKGVGGKVASKIGKASVITLEKVVSELALPAAIVSTAASGSYISRGVSGVADTVKLVAGGVETYVSNTGVRDALNGFALDVMQNVGYVANNIRENPEKVLYTAIGTYLACKMIPYVSKKIRGRIGRKD